MSEGSAFDLDQFSPPTLRTKTGHTVQVHEEDGVEQVELRDAEANLMLLFEPGTGRVVVSSSTGDLALVAPKGHIDLVAGKGVRCASQESISFRAGGAAEDAPASSLHLDEHQASLRGEHLEVAGERAELHVGETTYVGQRLEATVTRAKWAVERLESHVDRLVERAKTVHRSVEGLQRVTAGRVFSVIKGAYRVQAKNASLRTDEELTLDGDHIYLG
jgi:hypothetical protein